METATISVLFLAASTAAAGFLHRRTVVGRPADAAAHTTAKAPSGWLLKHKLVAGPPRSPRPAAPSSAELDGAARAIRAAPLLSPSLDNVTLVCTREQLRAAAAFLTATPLLAVDVEHSPHSFHGFVCSVQLSTGSAHYFVDCLVGEVRDALYTLLQPLFASPSTLKLLHGGTHDVAWLASNFGVTLTPVCDTAVAARLIRGGKGSASSSLAGLASDYLGLTMSKSLQRADWRTRPLPGAMLTYAMLDAAVLPSLCKRLLCELSGLAPILNMTEEALCVDAAAEMEERFSDALLRASAASAAQLQSVRYDAASREAFPVASICGIGARYLAGEMGGPTASGVASPALSWAMQCVRDAETATVQPPERASSSTSPWVVEVEGMRAWMALCRWRHAVALGADVAVSDVAQDGALWRIVLAVMRTLRVSGGRGGGVGACVADTIEEVLEPAYSRSALQCVEGTLATASPSSLSAPSPSDNRPPQQQSRGIVACMTAGMVPISDREAEPRASGGEAGTVLSVTSSPLSSEWDDPSSSSSSGGRTLSRGSPSATAPTVSIPLSGAATSSVSSLGEGSSNVSAPSTALELTCKATRASLLFTARSKPLYANIRLHAPDGTLLAIIDVRKAATYVKIGAAQLVEPPPQDVDDYAAAVARAPPLLWRHPAPSSPISISSALLDSSEPALTGSSGPAPAGTSPPAPPPGSILRMFRPPGGPGQSGDSFHLQPKVNRCVVCGAAWGSAGLHRCYIVPHGLRSHFPLAAKSYTSHDVVLACGACHHRADLAMASLLSCITREMGVPLGPKEAERLGLLAPPAIAQHQQQPPPLQELLYYAAAGSSRRPSLAGADPAAADVSAADAVAALRRGSIALLVHARGRAVLPAARIAELRRPVLHALERHTAVMLDLLEAAAAADSLSAVDGRGNGGGGKERGAGKGRGGGGGVKSFMQGASLFSAPLPTLSDITGDAAPSPSLTTTSTVEHCAASTLLVAPATDPHSSPPAAPPHERAPATIAALVRQFSDGAPDDVTAADAPLLKLCSIVHLPAVPRAPRSSSVLPHPVSGVGVTTDAGGAAADTSPSRLHADTDADTAAAVHGNSAPSQQPNQQQHQPQVVWDPLTHVIRAVLLGNDTWRRAERFYPSAVCECSGGPPSSTMSTSGESAGESSAGQIITNDRLVCRVCSAAAAAAGSASGTVPAVHAAAGAVPPSPARRGTSGLPLDAEDRLTRFVQRWRRNFVAFCRPAAMPAGWAVGYKVLQSGIRRKGAHEGALFLEVEALWAAQEAAAVSPVD